MKKQAALLIAAILMTPILAHAQSGCVNSPENPTAILGLVGSAAAGLCALRARFLRAQKRR